MFLFFSRSGYMKDKMNSLARSNASLYAKQHGNGRYTNVKGEVREGVWEDGRRTKWVS